MVLCLGRTRRYSASQSYHCLTSYSLSQQISQTSSQLDLPSLPTLWRTHSMSLNLHAELNTLPSHPSSSQPLSPPIPCWWLEIPSNDSSQKLKNLLVSFSSVLFTSYQMLYPAFWMFQIQPLFLHLSHRLRPMPGQLISLPPVPSLSSSPLSLHIAVHSKWNIWLYPSHVWNPWVSSPPPHWLSIKDTLLNMSWKVLHILCPLAL